MHIFPLRVRFAGIFSSLRGVKLFRSTVNSWPLFAMRHVVGFVMSSDDCGNEGKIMGGGSGRVSDRVWNLVILLYEITFG